MYGVSGCLGFLTSLQFSISRRLFFLTSVKSRPLPRRHVFSRWAMCLGVPENSLFLDRVCYFKLLRSGLR